MIFRDLVQKALKDGRLQFGKKPKSSMKRYSDPMQTEDAHCVKPVEILMVEVAEGSTMEVDRGEHIFDVTDSDMQAVYP